MKSISLQEITQRNHSLRLFTAINKGDIEEVNTLLRTDYVDIRFRDSSNQSCLHLAMAKNASAIVALLLEIGGLTEEEDACGNTPLHVGAQVGALEAVKKLVTEGKDIRLDRRNKQGMRPIDLAPKDSTTRHFLAEAMEKKGFSLQDPSLATENGVSDDAQPWRCGACTYLNAFERAWCEMCNQVRPGALLQPSQPLGRLNGREFRQEGSIKVSYCEGCQGYTLGEGPYCEQCSIALSTFGLKKSEEAKDIEKRASPVLSGPNYRAMHSGLIEESLTILEKMLGSTEFSNPSSMAVAMEGHWGTIDKNILPPSNQPLIQPERESLGLEKPRLNTPFETETLSIQAVVTGMSTAVCVPLPTVQERIQAKYKRKIRQTVLKEIQIGDTRVYAQLTPLSEAASQNDIAGIDLVLSHLESNVNERISEYGKAALHFAVLCGHLQTVETLIKHHKAEVDIETAIGVTPLHFAAMLGNVDMVKLLISCNAQVDAADRYNATPLRTAAKNGHLKVVELLLGHTKNIDAPDHLMNTPLHWGILNHEYNIAIQLLVKKAKVDIKNKEGYTQTDYIDLYAQGRDKDTLWRYIKNREPKP